MGVFLCPSHCPEATVHCVNMSVIVGSVIQTGVRSAVYLESCLLRLFFTCYKHRVCVYAYVLVFR